LPLSAFAADPVVCKNYAQFAVEDFKDGTYGANQQRCKIQRDARWNDNFQAHYKWCLTATDAAWRSEEKARKDRLTNCLSLRRAFKLRGKLGAEGGIGDYVEKPKWMRWQTYDRKLEEIFAAEEIVDAHTLMLDRKLDRLLGR
jgi:hypothetical protein